MTLKFEQKNKREKKGSKKEAKEENCVNSRCKGAFNIAL
jgi:hypothetical protein